MCRAGRHGVTDVSPPLGFGVSTYKPINERESMSRPRSKSRAPKKPKARHSFSVTGRTSNQKKYIKSIIGNTVTLCSGFAGTGKAQPLDAIVYTPDGPKPMGQLKVGDMVLTPDGKSAKILGVYPQGKVPIVRVTFSDGTSTECCIDHLWETKTSTERDAKKTGTVRSTKEIMESLHYNGKRNHSIPTTTPVEFYKKNLPIHPYLLGIILGDGCISQKMAYLSTTDEEVVEIVNELCSQLGVTLKKKIGNNCDYTFVKTGTLNWKIKNPLVEKLELLELMGKKSYEKTIPCDYKYTSSQDRLELLRGLMDSDGTIYSERGYSSVSFTSTSFKLANDVKFLIESLGGKANLSNRTTSYTHDGIKKKGRISYRVHISMPPSLNPFRLERKAAKYIPRKKYLPTRYIDNIEHIGEKAAQCILIDSDEHLYLTNNFIVTHNTLLAIGMALQLAYDKDTPYVKVIVVRPAIEACGESIGYLPGDMNDKMRPLIQPIIDNLRVFVKDEGEITRLTDGGGAMAPLIEVVPMSYLRGRTFNNCVIVFDEAQNATPAQMKLFLTRIGEGCKVVIEGDVTQSDRYEKHTQNGLFDAIRRLEGCKDVGVVTLEIGDIQRNPIIGKILERYKDIGGI